MTVRHVFLQDYNRVSSILKYDLAVGEFEELSKSKDDLNLLDSQISGSYHRFGDDVAGIFHLGDLDDSAEWRIFFNHHQFVLHDNHRYTSKLSKDGKKRHLSFFDNSELVFEIHYITSEGYDLDYNTEEADFDLPALLHSRLTNDAAKRQKKNKDNLAQD